MGVIALFAGRLLKKIREYKKIAFFVHIQPDFDAYASAFGFKEWLKDNFPEIKTYLVIPPETFKNEEKFLFNCEEPMPSTSDLHDCLAIVVDTPKIERILTNYHTYCKEMIVIDHHPKEKSFADLDFIDPTYPAVSQILAELFFYLEEQEGFSFGPKLCQYFYAGIMTDTNNFLSPATNPSTYLVLSKLSAKGLNRSKIHDFIFIQNINHKSFNAQVISNSRMTKNGLVYSEVTRGAIKKYKMKNFPNVVNMLSNISNVEIWSVLVYDLEIKKWKCSIRSKELNINHIAKLYGGGGHKNAAAVVFKYRWDFYRLLSTLDDYLIKCGYLSSSSIDSRGNWKVNLFKLFNWYKKV